MTKEVLEMKDKRMLTIAIVAGVLAVVGGRAICAQDKYTVKVPGGLASLGVQGDMGGMARPSPSVGTKRWKL